MSRKRILTVATFGALAIGLTSAWLLRPPPSLINAENAKRIHAGMKLSEVIAILGSPRVETTRRLDTSFQFLRCGRRKVGQL